MPLKIIRNDITKMNTEAIVNTANAAPTVGAGCDFAIYKAAGYDELLKYRNEKIGFVPEGEVFLTPGFELPTKYIIHAVSPQYRGGDKGAEDKLRSCYRKSLQLAMEKGIRSIAFPLIATGSFAYPKEEGLRIAVDEINAFLLKQEMDIFLVVFDETSSQLGEKIYPKLESYIDRNYAKELQEKEYAVDFEEFDTADVPRAGKRTKVTKKEKFIGSSLNLMRASQCLQKAEPEFRCYSDEDTADCSFFEEHGGKLEERMKHLSDTYSEYLMYLISERKLENNEVWKRAIVDRKIFSKIKNDVNYHPNKLTALCLCIGAELNLDETKDLLARAGYALSPCDKTDIIFSYFIENKIYDMIELDIQLEEHGLPCIIT